jgi:penicillin V acylase-like amidase (Ntn superfamily)
MVMSIQGKQKTNAIQLMAGYFTAKSRFRTCAARVKPPVPENNAAGARVLKAAAIARAFSRPQTLLLPLRIPPEDSLS